MSARISSARNLILLLLVIAPLARAADGADAGLPRRALLAELRSAQNQTFPMRYRLRKSSPRLTTTKEIFETRDGNVARLIALNDKPLNPADEQKEQARLDALLSDPGRQRHRKQAESEDTNRVLKVLRALPDAFIYQYAGTAPGPRGKVEKFAFRPNPNFHPQDLETQVLTAMAGEIWIDPAEERVTRLEGHLQQDVDFGWGILGRLYRGGWVVIEQADVGNRQWKIVRFQMGMTGRIVLKSKSFDTEEVESNFIPVPAGLGYAEAIRMLRADNSKPGQTGR